MKAPRRILLVIPAYHESGRMPAFLRALAEELSLPGLPQVDIQVVDDGSGAAEQAALATELAPLARRFSAIRPLLLLPSNQGKGAAIRHGWTRGADADSADWLAFVDADGAIPPREVRRLVSGTCESSNQDTTIFASRVRMLGRCIERSALRHYVGRLFATLIGMTICDRVYDTQCGFKLLPIEAWKRIADDLREPGFAFDVELLAALQSHDCPIREEPIDWIDQPGSRVRLLRDSWRMLRAVMRIRRRFAQ